MIVLTFMVENITDYGIKADLLDLSYLQSVNKLFIPSKEFKIDVLYEDTDRKEAKTVSYFSLVQTLLSPDNNMLVKLLEQSSDTYPPRFIWYKRMDFDTLKQDQIVHVNLLMPEDGTQHKIGTFFMLTAEVMLKLYLYPGEQYRCRLEVISPENWKNIGAISEKTFFSKNLN